MLIWLVLGVVGFSIYQYIQGRNEDKLRNISDEIVESLNLYRLFYDRAEITYEAGNDDLDKAKFDEQVELVKSAYNFELSTLLMNTLLPYQIKEKHARLKVDGNINGESILPGFRDEALKRADKLLLELRARFEPKEYDPDISTRRRRRR